MSAAGSLSSITDSALMVIGAGCVVAGAGVLLITLFHSYRAMLSHRWPATTGNVLDAKLEQRDAGESGVLYRARIRYTYFVGKSQYIGQHVFMGDNYFWYWSSAHAHRDVERYQPGSAVEVHFNPAHPAEAVLEPGPQWGSLVWLLPGASLLVVAGAALLRP